MKNNYNILTYFLANSLFLGEGLSLILSTSGKDSWLSAILGVLLGIGIIYIFNKMNPTKKDNIITKIVYFIYLLFLTFILLVTLSTFLYSYFLPNTPVLIICIPFIFLATYLNSKSIKNIYYVALPLIGLSIFIILLKSVMLIDEMDFSNFTPILTVSTTNIFKSAFLFAIISTAPSFLLAHEDITFKESLKYYLISSILNILVIITITSVLGSMLNIFSYPEYSVLRKIKILSFIENIENFIAITWLFDIFITLSLIGLKFKETLNTKKRIIPFIICSIIMLIISFVITNNYYLSMYLYNIFPYILSILVILLIILYLLENIILQSNKNIRHS